VSERGRGIERERELIGKGIQRERELMCERDLKREGVDGRGI
jgi:hypothetical protein